MSKLESILQQMKENGATLSDSMIVTKKLMTLPASFSHFYSAWVSISRNVFLVDIPLGCFKYASIVKKWGYWKFDCPVFRRKNGSGKQSSAKGEAYVSCSVSTAFSELDREWFLDSGASSWDRDWFINYKKLYSTIAVRRQRWQAVRGDISQWLEWAVCSRQPSEPVFTKHIVLDKNLELMSGKQKCELMKDGVVISVGVRYSDSSRWF